MGRVFIQFLDSGQQSQPTETQAAAVSKDSFIYACKYCKNHLAGTKDLVSKSFHGKTGPAFLFNQVVNIFLGPESNKEMMTGTHTVCDVYCVSCCVIIGWTYIKAFE